MMNEDARYADANVAATLEPRPGWLLVYVEVPNNGSRYTTPADWGSGLIIGEVARGGPDERYGVPDRVLFVGDKAHRLTMFTDMNYYLVRDDDVLAVQHLSPLG